jgi:hypothetical protein
VTLHNCRLVQQLARRVTATSHLAHVACGLRVGIHRAQRFTAKTTVPDGAADAARPPAGRQPNERVVFEFRTETTAAGLARFVPSNPRLSATVYVMILSSYLGRTSLHAALLEVTGGVAPPDAFGDLLRRAAPAFGCAAARTTANLLRVLAYLYYLQVRSLVFVRCY